MSAPIQLLSTERREKAGRVGEGSKGGQWADEESLCGGYGRTGEQGRAVGCSEVQGTGVNTLGEHKRHNQHVY